MCIRDSAEARLLVEWRKPRIRALCRALGGGAQAQEDMAFDVQVSTTLEDATGHALDQWGELVGEQRGPLSDNDYRPFIYARLLANRCAGTIDSDEETVGLLEVLEACTGDFVRVWHEDNFPAGLYLVVERRSFMTLPMLRRVSRLMEQVRPAGRHMTVIETVVGGYGFEDDTEAEGLDVGPFSRLVLPLP